ncbi:hypothetical protein [Agromyces sp. H66]|uniref:hypothetical protein n=1 Tax=Agromyces sp. H66 TaxID=2529859 RepID=UPI0010AA3832|nr:hypothetical protein [Agromyces sp. H66]
MNTIGADSPLAHEDLLVAARSALLDALDALEAHRDAVIVIGAQAIYLRTKSSLVALAEATKDSDLAIDPRALSDDPKVEEAMRSAHFYPNPVSGNPGEWMNSAGIPVDLMVPEALAGPGRASARGARIPPHSRRATRRASGLEAALIDNDRLEVAALDTNDKRVYRVRVAGLAALLVAKLHKLGERAATAPRRLHDKDAHDIYRILVASDTGTIAAKFVELVSDDMSSAATAQAIEYLREHFAAGAKATGSAMAGRAEEGVGDPDFVSQSVSILADELLVAIDKLSRNDGGYEGTDS